jgi:hypothetical protein
MRGCACVVCMGVRMLLLCACVVAVTPAGHAFGRKQGVPEFLADAGEQQPDEELELPNDSDKDGMRQLSFKERSELQAWRARPHTPGTRNAELLAWAAERATVDDDTDGMPQGMPKMSFKERSELEAWRARPHRPMTRNAELLAWAAERATADDDKVGMATLTFKGRSELEAWRARPHKPGTRNLKRCPFRPGREPDWQPLIDNLQVWPGAQKGKPRIFCMIYTMKGVGGQTNQSRLPLQTAQNTTWAGGCDRFTFFSDEPLEDGLPHVVVEPDFGKESYNNMWAKVRTMWKWARAHTADDFDYWLIGGDDLYVNVPNLRKYLLTPRIVDADKRKVRELGRRVCLALPARHTVH